MKFSVFLELIEAKAKAASIFPFLIGLCFSWYHFKQINIKLTLLFFISMLLFNIAVDILNNYSDYTRAWATDDYKHSTNIIGREQISLTLIKQLLFFFLTSSFLIGLYLAYIVGWDVLFLGILSFSIGIFYSWGPRPLNSLPVGELASGLSMGFLIPLIIIRLNDYPSLLWQDQSILAIFILSLPFVLWISNVMLSNNICDLKEDIENQRYTLVYYIGKKMALRLFTINHFIAYLAILVSCLLKIAPWTYGLSLVTIPFVIQQNRLFMTTQIKSQTFICAIKILIITSIAQVVSYMVGIFI